MKEDFPVCNLNKSDQCKPGKGAMRAVHELIKGEVSSANFVAIDHRKLLSR